MSLLRLIDTDLDKYIKDTYVILNNRNLNYDCLRMPTIYIIGMSNFTDTFTDYIDYSESGDELILCLPSGEIFDYLTDYFDKTKNAEQQFLMDGYRSVLCYNAHIYSGEKQINMLCEILKFVYEQLGSERYAEKFWSVFITPPHKDIF